MAKLKINGIEYNFSGSGLGATPVAAEITYDGTESNLEATNLQDAVDKVNSKIENGYTTVYQVECPEFGIGEDTIVPKFGVAEGGNNLLTEIFAAESLDTAIQTLASALYIFIDNIKYNLGEVKTSTHIPNSPYFFGNEQIGYAYNLGKWNDTIVADTGELFYIELGSQDTFYGIKKIILKEAGEVKFVNYPLNDFHVHNDIRVGDTLDAKKKTIAVQNSLNSAGVHVSESGNAGVYDFEHENWMLYSTPEGNVLLNGGIGTQTVREVNTDVNNYITPGLYYFTSAYTPKNSPSTNGFLFVFGGTFLKQVWMRQGTINTNDYQIFWRTSNDKGATWSDWHKPYYMMEQFYKASVAFNANENIKGGTGSADGVWLTSTAAVDNIVKVDQNAYTITIPEPGVYCIDARIYRNDGNELHVKGSIWRKKSTETEWTLLKNCGAIPNKYIYGTLNDTIWLKTTEDDEQIGFWVNHNSTSQTAAIVGNGNSGLTITRLA